MAGRLDLLYRQQWRQALRPGVRHLRSAREGAERRDCRITARRRGSGALRGVPPGGDVSHDVALDQGQMLARSILDGIDGVAGIETAAHR